MSDENKVKELQQDLEEETALRERLSDLLTRTATGLKGSPPADTWWSWHDLPIIAQRYKEALESIASCKVQFPGDVVDIAQKALFKRDE